MGTHGSSTRPPYALTFFARTSRLTASRFGCRCVLLRKTWSQRFAKTWAGQTYPLTHALSVSSFRPYRNNLLQFTMPSPVLIYSPPLVVFRYLVLTAAGSQQLWDTAGEDRYRDLCYAFFKGADAAVFVYDVNDEKTFSALDAWKSEFYTWAGLKNAEGGAFVSGMEEPNFPVFVIGNKIDQDLDRVISTVKGSQWAEGLPMASFYETSIKTDACFECGTGGQEPSALATMFESVVQKVLESKGSN